MKLRISLWTMLLAGSLLNGSPAAFQIVDTNRGREVHVQSNSGGKQELAVDALR
jgi:hypothetical protein